jgi:nucleoside 2-deoxyribosyltransferase
MPTRQKPQKRHVVYIAGPITDVPDYKRAFNQAENELLIRGYIPIKPSTLPQGMTEAQYMRICLSMIDAADAVLVLPGSHKSDGVTVEYTYAKYIGKPVAFSIDALKEVLTK